MKSFEQIKEEAKGNGYIEYEGKTYYFLNGAYADNYQNEAAIFANAVTGELDEDGELVEYKIRWDYTGEETSEDWADWEHPIEITTDSAPVSLKYGKEDFKEMIKDWQSDNAEEMADLKIREPETGENGNWVAYAEDEKMVYSLTDDGTGNIRINYIGSK